MTLGERLKLIRGDLSLEAFGSLISTPQVKFEKSNLSKYERDSVRPTTDFYIALSEKLGININWLLTNKGDMVASTKDFQKAEIILASTKLKKIPVLGLAECGKPVSKWNDNAERFIELPETGQLDSPFILIAHGDSMRPYINPLDKLLCSDEPERIKDGSAVVVSFKSIPDTYEANAKLIMKKKDHCVLYSINSKYPPTIHKYDEIVKIYKVNRIIRDVR
jgi:SOS-response transcriptional repressor LexA